MVNAVEVEESQRHQLDCWIKLALPGQSRPYYRGFLWADRELATGYDPALRWADLVWQAHEAGYVTLVQAKHGPFDYTYIAIRTRRRFDDRPKRRERGD
jgi:hypothetical protein